MAGICECGKHFEGVTYGKKLPRHPPQNPAKSRMGWLRTRQEACFKPTRARLHGLHSLPQVVSGAIATKPPPRLVPFIEACFKPKQTPWPLSLVQTVQFQPQINNHLNLPLSFSGPGLKQVSARHNCSTTTSACCSSFFLPTSSGVRWNFSHKTTASAGPFLSVAAYQLCQPEGLPGSCGATGSPGDPPAAPPAGTRSGWPGVSWVCFVARSPS